MRDRADMRRRPNVLFVITDQQRADHNGFMGNPVLETPHLDALAASGMVFDNAWVSNPVCMPNRCTMMTGRMPSAHGVIFNDRSLERDANTFVRRFRKSGYRTGLIGKSHLQHGMSRNAVFPFRGEPSGALPFPDGWDRLEDFERYVDGQPEDPEDFYGFGHVEFSIDHGARVAGHHLQWALERGGRLPDLLTDQDAPGPGTDRSPHWRQIYRPPYPEELHSSAFVAERTIAFIEAAETSGEPWLAWCSFPDPHHPMTPPGKWFDAYRPADMPLPDTRDDPLEGAPEHLRRFAAVHPRDQRNWVAPCGFGEDTLLREAIAASGKRALYILSVDLAHIGPKFGDPAPVDDAGAAACERADRALMDYAQRFDSAGFTRSLSADGNSRKVDAVAGLYSLYPLLAGGERHGTLLAYGQNRQPDTGSLVSYASMAFYQSGAD